MGNCIPIEKKTMNNNIDGIFTSGSAGENIRLLISNEGDLMFFTDDPKQDYMKVASKSDIGSQKITFMLTKKQLAQLLYSTNGVKEFGPVNELAFRIMENAKPKEQQPKWRPSLVTILE